MTPLVTTETNPKHIIIGVDTLQKSPEILKTENTHKNIFAITSDYTKLLTKYEKIFNSEITPEKLCAIQFHEIHTQNHLPITQQNFRIPIHYENAIEEEIQKILKLGIIKESKSPWASRIVPIEKPDGSIRLCVDYRALNSITIKDNYPLPRIDEIIDSLSQAKIFSTLDATSGFYQIPIRTEDTEKTAFTWKNGLFEFVRMPFGLCNAPATFQRVMDKIFSGQIRKFAIPYLDDIIIFSKSAEEHLDHLEIVLNKLKSAGITLNEKKCKIMQGKVKYLGYIVENGKVSPDPEKIEAIKNFTLPNTIKELRSFLGVCVFCTEFIPNYAKLVAPLNELLKGETKNSIRKINWTKEALKAFEAAKEEIAKVTFRFLPDINKPFILITDASNIAYGAVLVQVDNEGKERMVSCFSKKFDKAQCNYSVTDKELLGVVKGMEHFRHYLL